LLTLLGPNIAGPVPVIEAATVTGLTVKGHVVGPPLITLVDQGALPVTLALFSVIVSPVRSPLSAIPPTGPAVKSIEFKRGTALSKVTLTPVSGSTKPLKTEPLGSVAETVADPLVKV
jgi:hypothetical protein